MSNDEKPLIVMPAMCQMHQRLLLSQLGIGPNGPWRSHILVAQVTLFQAATAFSATYDRIGGDLGRLSELGCLACYRPDAFGEVVHAFQTGGMAAVKLLGERYVNDAASSTDDRPIR
jgi:hypothetical protein